MKKRSRIQGFEGSRIRVKQGGSGFTLLEILVALFLFSIIVTTIFGSYRFVFSHADAITSTLNTEEMANNCLNRIMLDLQAIYIDHPQAYRPSSSSEDQDDFRIVGEMTSLSATEFSVLRFASLEHLPFNRLSRQGVAEIKYYVDIDRDDRFVLRRADRLLPFDDADDQTTKDPILCESVASFKVNFMDGSGDQHERWDSESDSTGYATPRAISIELAIGNETASQSYTTTVMLPVQRPQKSK